VGPADNRWPGSLLSPPRTPLAPKKRMERGKNLLGDLAAVNSKPRSPVLPWWAQKKERGKGGASEVPIISNERRSLDRQSWVSFL